ncbi:MAG: hypothetical protein NTW21_06300 [Verrucomicrobia bacterium]|nr:hypothetical protein [Verrucomicrobiota bacterium]
MPIGIWWLGTRRMDFLTPPSEARLAAIRQQTEASLPPPRIRPPRSLPQVPVTPAPAPIPEKKPEPGVEIGDLNPNPGLNTYAELAPKGARHLIELASLLETAGEFPRTLLAWERVLDSTQPEPPQATAAIAAIKRLRPTVPAWNVEAAAAIPIVIHASTDTPLEKTLRTTLEQAANDLQRSSSGILKVTAKVTIIRKRSPRNTPPDVALWLSGSAEKSAATETLSFSVTKPENLQADILRKLFRLVSKHLEHDHACAPIIPAAADEAPLDVLEFHLTRLHWQDLGRSLNAAKAPAPKVIR